MKTQQSKHKQRGSAVVELALSVFLLLAVMTGITEFGRMFYHAAEVANAARAGVQWAVVNPGNPNNLTAMQTAATNDAVNISGLSAVATETCECDDGGTVDCTTGTCATGSVRTYVQVVTTAPYAMLANYWWMPQSVTVGSRAVIRVD